MKLKQLAFIDFGIFVLAVILVCQLTSLPKTVFAQDKERRIQPISAPLVTNGSRV